MFIAHFGVAMAAKRVAPRPSLGTPYRSSLSGPPPPSVCVLAMSGLVGRLFIVWAHWIERHRAPAAARSRETS
ncbi:MAG: hypothetical protein ABI886_11300 [Betaproteobacteria bacterium]